MVSVSCQLVTIVNYSMKDGAEVDSIAGTLRLISCVFGIPRRRRGKRVPTLEHFCVKHFKL